MGAGWDRGHTVLAFTPLLWAAPHALWGNGVGWPRPQLLRTLPPWAQASSWPPPLSLRLCTHLRGVVVVGTFLPARLSSLWLG